MTAAVLLASGFFILERQWTQKIIFLLLHQSGQIQSQKIISFALMPNANWVFSLPLPTVWIFVLTVVIVTAITYLYITAWKFKIFYVLSYSLILAGAISNLYSRWTMGFVWDYIHLRVWKLSGWWNLADLFILGGIVCFAIGSKTKETN